MIGVVRFLPTVVITGTPSPAQTRLLAACDAAARYFTRDVTITCGEDGHPPTDPHTLRKAFDVRTEDLAPADTRALYDFLTHDLGTAWTVLYEAPTFPGATELAAIWYPDPHTTGPHIHVQPLKGTDYPPVPATTVSA